MANPSAAKLRRKDKTASRAKSPPPPTSSEDAAGLPTRLEALVLSALNTPLSVSSLTSGPSTRRPTPTPSRKPDKMMPPPRPVHLLIASLGNPAPYHNTRPSAGHLLLKSLASHANAPPLQKSRDFGGLVSSTTTPSGTTWAFFQSPSLMNVSGPAILKAFKTFTSQHPRSPDYECGLVILHDELELDPGKSKIKRGDGSAKGHNGIKSVQASLPGAGLMLGLGGKFVKIGVGIGRPISRERDDVSGYVLGQLTAGERAKIEGAAEGVLEMLEREAERMGK
jgi:PTH1 family peptidyl-tRNA hydrolase